MQDCVDHGQKGDKDGYGSTVRHISGERKYVRMHRAMFFDVHGYWPRVVRHTCDNPRCINPHHLVPGTVADNNRDRATRGRNADVNGESNPAHKLTDAQIVELKELAKTHTRKALAVKYGINLRHVFRILSGERRNGR